MYIYHDGDSDAGAKQNIMQNAFSLKSRLSSGRYSQKTTLVSISAYGANGCNTYYTLCNM